jgi:hypothetical protein
MVHAECSFEQDAIALEHVDAGRGQVVVAIKENRT